MNSDVSLSGKVSTRPRRTSGFQASSLQDGGQYKLYYIRVRFRALYYIRVRFRFRVRFRVRVSIRFRFSIRIRVGVRVRFRELGTRSAW